MLATASVMLRRIILTAFGGVLLAVTASASEFDPGESVTLDPATGDYIVTFVGENGVPARSVFDPANKIEPVVVSQFSRDSSGHLAYGYVLKNGLAAKQPICCFWLDYINNLKSQLPPIRNDVERESITDMNERLARRKACKESLSATSTWSRSCSTSKQGISIDFTRKDLANKLNGVLPGQEEKGFGFSSLSLPGVFPAKLLGNNSNWKEGGHPHPHEEDTYEISDALDNKLGEITTNDFIVRNIAVPAFEVPAPFNGVPLLEKIRDHVKGWPQQQLMEQSFWTQIDGLLAAAINALKNGDTAGAATNLAQTRVELRKKYPDLDVMTALDDPKASALPTAPDALKGYLSAHDQRLAAKVLDFDVAFITKKLGPTLQ